MSHCTAHFICILSGGVFDGATDMADTAARIKRVALQLDESGRIMDKTKQFESCLKEVCGPKGSWIVIGGTFNYWDHEEVSKFAAALSVEFSTDVMLHSLDMERNIPNLSIFCRGEKMRVGKTDIGDIIRRV